MSQALNVDVVLSNAVVEAGLDVPRNACELDQIAARILTRDHILHEGARYYWLQNGQDLIAAKLLLRHGHFENWCKEQLSYSKSKAEKLMRATEMFGPLLESRTVTDLPLPTALYTLSAPSVPQAIRDEFTPRILAKEEGIGSKLKEAIEQHRKKAKRAERGTESTPEAQIAQARREAAQARREVREAEQRRVEQERAAAARSAALALIQARLGDDLPALIALAAEAGSGSVFSSDAERELQALMREQTTPAEGGAGFVADKPEVADVETVTASAGNVIGPPASSVRTNAIHDDNAVEPPPDRPLVDDTPLSVLNVPAQVDAGKVGDCGPVASTLPTLQREPRPKFTQSRGRLRRRPKFGGSPGGPSGRSG